MDAYESALQKLYAAPVAAFVAERKRLAAELRAAGDPEAAKRLAGRHRPTTSAWTVNQLYRHARAAFDEMLRAAADVQRGDLGATSGYRDAIATLRKRAAALLADAGYGATEPTLRRVATTLAAIAASGGFAPDPPGALSTDRDPPGFEALGSAPEGGSHAGHARATRQAPSRGDTAGAGHERGHATTRAEAAAERRRVRAAEQAERAEQKRRDAEDARRNAERRSLETRLHAAKKTAQARERALASMQEKLRAAEKDAADAREAVRDLERRVREVDGGRGPRFGDR